ncbi:hypothetical protein FS842_005503 [Serendipita sp. 407]|nr:hypothetical protein FS842_005503 [Serendipita sp. 407]
MHLSFTSPLVFEVPIRGTHGVPVSIPHDPALYDEHDDFADRTLAPAGDSRLAKRRCGDHADESGTTEAYTVDPDWYEAQKDIELPPSTTGREKPGGTGVVITMESVTQPAWLYVQPIWIV